MTNDTLVLRLRAEALQTNLTRLREHLATPDRLAGLHGLEELRAAALRSLNRAEKAWLSLKFKFQSGHPVGIDEKIDPDAPVGTDEDRTVEDTFNAVQADLTAAETTLRSLQSALEKMRRDCFQVTQTPVGEQIIEELRKQTQPLIAQLAKIQTIKNSPQDLAEGWKMLRGDGAAAYEPLLADYMELLGGAALRDTGFDERISYFADELIRSTGGRLLALPTRRQALITTIKRIIRVTFPDWTVWALPAAALEFWNVVEYNDLKNTLVANLPLGEEQLKPLQPSKYLGDAFATYSMGPAYAFYAVALLLAPDLEEDQSRVRAIISMLQCMEENPAGTRYREVRQQLLTAWNAARTQLEQRPLTLDVNRPGDADESDPDGRDVRVLVRALWKTLELETSAKFNAEIWTVIQPWVPLLLAGKAEEISVPNGVEFRHLLNAAWLARVNPNRDLAVDLNAAVATLQSEIKKRREALRRPGGR